MWSQSLRALAIVAVLPLFSGPSAAATLPASVGALATLAFPSTLQPASLWSKPYPYGYVWRVTPCPPLYYWVEPRFYVKTYVKRRVIKRGHACR